MTIRASLLGAPLWWLGLAIPQQLFGGIGPMFDRVIAEHPEYLTLPGPAPGTSDAQWSAEVLLSILARVETRVESARLLLQDLLGQRHVDGVLASAAAVAAAFADEGRPVSLEELTASERLARLLAAVRDPGP